MVRYGLRKYSRRRIGFLLNLEIGIYLEANQGPITIKNSRVCRNKHYGILIANSARVNLERNILYGNAPAQIMVSGLYDSARPETNWETGAKMGLLAEQAAWMHNVVVGTETKQFLVSTTLSPPLWRHFVDSLKSDRNVWFHPQDSTVFQVAGGYRGILSRGNPPRARTATRCLPIHASEIRHRTTSNCTRTAPFG